jgi:hypothetical protein
MTERTFVVDHERTINVFKSSVSSQNSVVRFNNGVGHLGRRVNGEF